jgi:hypothetical protein
MINRIVLPTCFLLAVSSVNIVSGSETATEPFPADGETEVDTTMLEWTAPEVAVTNKVYLSTDETVDEADFLGETELGVQVVVLNPGVTY